MLLRTGASAAIGGDVTTYRVTAIVGRNCQVDSTTTEGVGLSTSAGFLMGVVLGALLAVIGWLIYQTLR